MNKLTTLLAIAFVSTGLLLTGCKNEKDKPATDPVAKPTTEEKKPEEKKPDEVKPEEKKPDETKPVAAADLPAECGDYKVAIEKLATCDKLPQQTRDALKQSYDQTSAAWASVPAEGKAALATACKAAADAVKQSAAACK